MTGNGIKLPAVKRPVPSLVPEALPVRRFSDIRPEK